MCRSHTPPSASNFCARPCWFGPLFAWKGPAEALNMRISPTAVNTPPRLQKICDLFRAYVDMGGFLVQVNIVSTQTLRDAQLPPERYRDLVVRVATYAAYFIELGPEMQNDIIRRIEFQEC